MAITSRKITAFAKDVSDLPNKTSGAFTAEQAKEQFDAAPNELRLALNGVIDDLGSTVVGDSGAKGIGIASIAGVTGANVQAAVEDLKLQINGAVAGSIPDGSIGPEKLSFTIATDAASVSIADTGAHFTATNVEGALDELFQSASSVKTDVANAIGAPATSSDTGTVLANRITTEKGRLAAEIGDGNSSSTLQYLSDRLIVRSDAIATAVNGKGVPATSVDTLAQLATKIGQITEGKKYAEGVATSSSAILSFIRGDGTSQGYYYVEISGLTFLPKRILVYTPDAADTADMFTSYTDDFNQIGLAGNDIVMMGTVFRINAVAYVNASGFRLPFNVPSAPVKWAAYGS